MADDSELDYVRTFVGSVMTGYTIKQFSEVKKLSLIADTQRGLVYPGEIITIHDVYFLTRYLLKLSDASESALTTGIKNLISGAQTYNARQTGPTQVADMTHIRIIPGSKSFEQGQTKRWYIDLNIDITWSVS